MEGLFDVAIVSGSRKLINDTLVRTAIRRHINREGFVVLGDASGVDSIARSYLQANGIGYRVLYADWEKYGKGAGPIRNQEMLDFALEVHKFVGGTFGLVAATRITAFQVSDPTRLILTLIPCLRT